MPWDTDPCGLNPWPFADWLQVDLVQGDSARVSERQQMANPLHDFCSCQVVLSLPLALTQPWYLYFLLVSLP